MKPRDVIMRIAATAEAIGWQAGVGGCETAGMIVSVLVEHPELIDSFLEKGSGALIDSDLFSWEHGRLTFHRAMDGAVTTPQELRIAKTVKRLERSLSAPPSKKG